MIKFKDGFSSESYYPDSNYYLNQDNTPKETPVSEDRISYMGGGISNGQIPIGLSRKEQMADSQ